MVDEEVFRRAERGLQQGIYALTWAGRFWGRAGAIRLARIRFKFQTVLGEEAGGLSALSSTYYAGSTSAWAEMRQSGVLGKPLWFVRSLWCLGRAARLSDSLERRFGQELTADELDVRASILRRVSRRKEAERCVQAALGKNPSPGTKALLLVSAMELAERRGAPGEAEEYLKQALAAADQQPPVKSVRIYRACASFVLRQVGWESCGRSLLQKAYGLAREAELAGQVVKIKAVAKTNRIRLSE